MTARQEALAKVATVIQTPLSDAATAVNAQAAPPACEVCAAHHSRLEPFGKDGRHYAGCRCGWEHGASLASRGEAGARWGDHVARLGAHACPVDEWLDARA